MRVRTGLVALVIVVLCISVGSIAQSPIADLLNGAYLRGVGVDNVSRNVIGVTRGANTVTIDPAAQGVLLPGAVTVTGTTTLNGQLVVNGAVNFGSGVSLGALAVGAAELTANLQKGVIQLDLFTARIISSNAIQNTTEAGVPDGNTDPLIARVNGATDKQGRTVWAASNSAEVQFAPFAYPPDLDDTQPVTFNFLAAMAGAIDTPTVAVAYFEGVGDTNAGGNTAAITGTTMAKYTVTIAASDVGVYPNVATVTLIPGTHTTDTLRVYAAWIEYQRRD